MRHPRPAQTWAPGGPRACAHTAIRSTVVYRCELTTHGRSQKHRMRVVGACRDGVCSIGDVTLTRASLGRWGGPYGAKWSAARWVCDTCGRSVRGTDDHPERLGDLTCVRNGHQPCRLCGTMLPALDCGCPREHQWTSCPGKTEADRITPQHGAAGHRHREATS